jgi:HK97 family phage prohead protease
LPPPRLGSTRCSAIPWSDGHATHRSWTSRASASTNTSAPSTTNTRRTKAAPATDVATSATADVLGEFEALVSDFLPDRQGERFAPHAFDGALDRIRKNGTACPVLFGHKQDTVSSVLGMVPSTGWSVTNDGLTAKGWIDVSDSVGAKVYRMLKNGSLLWSIGFRIVTGNKSPRGPDGTVVIDSVDELLELSVVPVPANSRTRTVGMKADHPAPTAAELREHEIRLGLGSAVDSLERNRRMIVPTMDELAAREAVLADLPFVERILNQRAPSLDAAVERMREQTRDEMLRILSSGDTGKAHIPRPGDEQRARANQMAAEFELERALSFDPRA